MDSYGLGLVSQVELSIPPSNFYNLMEPNINELFA